MMDGDRSVLSLGVDQNALRQVFRDASLVGDVDEFCAISTSRPTRTRWKICPAAPATPAAMFRPMATSIPACSFLCRRETCGTRRFIDIWRHSDAMNDVRSIRLKDLTTCTSCTHVSSCTRCPGLAFMEGNMRGPSSQDCEKSFVRTGVPSANMLAKKTHGAGLRNANLVQIRALPTSAGTSAAGAIA